MREIKFRGIDLDGNFRYGFFKRVGAYSWIQNEQGGDEAVIENTVGQFTGLKDKNGKEIYEGDILSTDDGPVIVGWNDIFASFVLNKKGWMYQHYFGESLDPNNCIVVGNIHQDPELLK